RHWQLRINIAYIVSPAPVESYFRVAKEASRGSFRSLMGLPIATQDMCREGYITDRHSLDQCYRAAASRRTSTLPVRGSNVATEIVNTIDKLVTADMALFHPSTAVSHLRGVVGIIDD